MANGEGLSTQQPEEEINQILEETAEEASPWSEEELAGFAEEARKDALVKKKIGERDVGAPWRKYTIGTSPTSESEFRTGVLEEDALQSLPELHAKEMPVADPGLNIVDPSAWKAGLDPTIVGQAGQTQEDYLSGINRQIWMQGQIADKLGKIGDKQAALIGLKADYGAGFPETLADAKLRIQKKYQQDTQAYQERFEVNMGEAELMAQYPGASIDQVRLWKRQMEFDPHRVGFSPEAAKDMLRRKATAMRNLARAEEIDPNRAFGGVTSQILAGLSVSLGAWASSKSGRPNTALDLYKHAITNDIMAQKEKFSHARGAPARARSQYAFWMSRYDNERVATLGTAMAQYGAAANTIQKEIAQLTGGVQKDQALAIQGQLLSQRDKLKMELAKAALAAEQAQNSGITGIDGKPIRYTGPAIGSTSYNQKSHDKLEETGRRRAMANAALEQYRDAFKAASIMPLTDSRKAAFAARQALIARLGDVWDKGVLQEFEWEQLDSMLPGGNISMAKIGINRVEAVLDELKSSFDAGFEAHIDSLSFYHQAGTGGFTGDVKGTGERGTAEGSGMTPEQVKAWNNLQRKGMTTAEKKLLMGFKSEREPSG